MATVSCFLLVIASGLVRDVYQRFINPAGDRARAAAADVHRDDR